MPFTTSSPASATSCSSFASTQRSFQPKDMPPMNALFSTAIDTSRENSQLTNGQVNRRGLNYSNLSVAKFPSRGSSGSVQGSNTSFSNGARQNNCPDISVPFYTSITKELPLKPMSTKDSLKNKFTDAVNDCCLKIDELSSSIEQDVIRLLYKDEFKNYFLRKLQKRLNERIQDRILDDKLWTTNNVSANADQQYDTLIPANVNVQIANDDGDDDIEHTLTNGDSTPNEIEPSSIELSSNRMLVPLDQDENLEQQQNVDEESAAGQEQLITSTHMHQTSDVQEISSNSFGSIDEQSQMSEASAEMHITESMLPHLSSSPESQSSEIPQEQINRIMSVRVLMERLPIEQSTVLTQDGAQQEMGCGDELNVLQHLATAIVPDDAHEEFIECADLEQTLSNGKRKANRTKAGGSLKKKTKLTVAGGIPNSKSFTCNICITYTTRHKGHFNMHMRTHSDEKPYECNNCKKRFTRNSDLKRHMSTHNGERPFECYICDKRFTRNSDLKRHMTTHNGERPQAYECNICKKRFTRNSHLKRHMSTHNGERPFECYICDKRFTQSFNLKRHMTSHQDSLTCSNCRKEFELEDKKKWIAHQNTCIITIRRFGCDICKKDFRHKKNLSAHMIKHTGERPFCSVCQKRFSCKRSLRRHMKICVK